LLRQIGIRRSRARVGRRSRGRRGRGLVPQPRPQL